jgi:dephospho-CoA kinase
MKIIGVTGGVGAGKSTVLAYLKEQYHAAVIEADQVGHEVIEPGGLCYDGVIALFGENIRKKDKTIDRRKVSDVVFTQEEMLSRLNALIHPAVKVRILERIEEERRAGSPFCVVEAALFLEEHYEEFCDDVWYVHTDREIRIARLIESRGYTRKKAQSIIQNQAPEEFFEANTDYKIINNGDLAETYRQIDERICDYETM